jgi:hypothetical protein
MIALDEGVEPMSRRKTTAAKTERPRRSRAAPAHETRSVGIDANALEKVARSLTERTMARLAGPGDHLAKLIEAHWQTTARELKAGLIDEEGNVLTSRYISKAVAPDGQEASGRSKGHARRTGGLKS